MSKRMKLILSIIQILASVAIAYVNFKTNDPWGMAINILLTGFFGVHAVWLWRIEDWHTSPDIARFEKLIQMVEGLKVRIELDEVTEVISGTLSLDDIKERLIERKRIWTDIKADCLYFNDPPSSYLKCAANPSAPCSECQEYETTKKDTTFEL